MPTENIEGGAQSQFLPHSDLRNSIVEASRVDLLSERHVLNFADHLKRGSKEFDEGVESAHRLSSAFAVVPSEPDASVRTLLIPETKGTTYE